MWRCGGVEVWREGSCITEQATRETVYAPGMHRPVWRMRNDTASAEPSRTQVAEACATGIAIATHVRTQHAAPQQLNSPFTIRPTQVSFPRAATGQTISTRSLRTPIMSLNRLLTTQQWFGITVTRSPTMGLWLQAEKST